MIEQILNIRSIPKNMKSDKFEDLTGHKPNSEERPKT